MLYKNGPLPAGFLETLSPKDVRKLVPREWMPYYPGWKEVITNNWCFYLYDGEQYNLRTGKMETVK